MNNEKREMKNMKAKSPSNGPFFNPFFFSCPPTPAATRPKKQRLLSTSVGRSLIDDDEYDDDVEAERTRVRMMIKVLRL